MRPFPVRQSERKPQERRSYKQTEVNEKAVSGAVGGSRGTL